ncbi:hypothetical protein mRhiFer1_009633 [Rhinolophus ferrumequinum]|uniref:Uncharacterized protein n=1 Tax=Rhinolophus ferrumequinum TaxID=59479 RepID=A0A7J7ZQP9_RHIFE|nr:hypothetical protein mRhiFer1_009633 [Rhinolophus ferrumequinum]
MCLSPHPAQTRATSSCVSASCISAAASVTSVKPSRAGASTGGASWPTDSSESSLYSSTSNHLAAPTSEPGCPGAVSTEKLLRDEKPNLSKFPPRLMAEQWALRVGAQAFPLPPVALACHSLNQTPVSWVQSPALPLTTRVTWATSLATEPSLSTCGQEKQTLSTCSPEWLCLSDEAKQTGSWAGLADVVGEGSSLCACRWVLNPSAQEAQQSRNLLCTRAPASIHHVKETRDISSFRANEERVRPRAVPQEQSSVP